MAFSLSLSLSISLAVCVRRCGGELATKHRRNKHAYINEHTHGYCKRHTVVNAYGSFSVDGEAEEVLGCCVVSGSVEMSCNLSGSR